MALINGLVTFHWRDSLGIEGTTPINVSIDDTKTIAQLETDVSTMVTNVESLSQALLFKSTVLIQLPGGAGIAPLGDIEKCAVFNFKNATDPYAQGIVIPDVAPAILNTSGLIDLTNADVTNFISAMTTAGTVITVVTKGVRALTGLIDALISFRKHRKPLSRKTKEV